MLVRYLIAVAGIVVAVPLFFLIVNHSAFLQEVSMNLIFGIVTTMSIGLMLGTEFAVSAFVNPILEKLDDSAQAYATRLFARKLGTVMPFWYGLNLLLLIGEAVTLRQHSGLAFLAAAGGGLIRYLPAVRDLSAVKSVGKQKSGI